MSQKRDAGGTRDDREQEPDAETLRLYAEELDVGKRQVVTGRVQVSAVTREHEKLIDELLGRERVEIETVPIGKYIDAMPAIRNEGDTIVIPVVEETLAIQRQLRLKEEVRVRRVRDEERYREAVTLRNQEAVVTRLAPDESNSNTT
ncbi:MAG TPA: DUF2382 domain-containing protein [Candidatus Cybelea sp.]|jgi:uncharacterized protein (TIGR02271 family)